MINIKALLFFSILLPILVFGQDVKLDGFDNLVNKTWKAEGEWSNGTKFKQEVSFEYDLNKAIVVTNSKGYVNQEQTEYGNRNHGVRRYNAEKERIEFWEFDVFGGVTTGHVEIKNKDIFYHYKYGDTMVTDGWEFIDQSTYKFTVGSYKDGKWEAVYLETKFQLNNE